MSLQVVGGAVNGQKEVRISVLLVHHGNEQFEVLNRAMQTLETPNLFMIFVFTSGIRLLMPVPACLQTQVRSPFGPQQIRLQQSFADVGDIAERFVCVSYTPNIIVAN